MQENSKLYKAAVYLRLSREDGDVADGNKQVSNSISNQKELVKDYLKSHAEIVVVSFYTDDGYSGVNFDRPQFQKMLSDIKDGKVNCVIVKDLSRFGRNYIESGRYIEKIFPMLGIRFIAITDGYDSMNEDMGSDMIIPFKNLINDAYCRDISTKVRSHMEVKRRNGEYIAPFAAYGYLKDPDDKNHLVVDEYAASVVQDIFAMKLRGMSQQAIADKLNADGIQSPLQYKKSRGVNFSQSFRQTIKPEWSYNAVLRVLKNEVYVGTVVQGKKTTPNYKIKKAVVKDKEDWIRVEGMHEPIISKEDFEMVQNILKRDTRVSPVSERREVRPLAGMLFCSDCGEPMVRKTVVSSGRRYVYYVCSGNKKDKTRCSSHSFSADRLENAVLESMRVFIGQSISLSEAVEIVNSSAHLKPDVAKYEIRINKLKEDMEGCKARRKNLYEDFKDGVLTKEEYIMLRGEYQKQQTQIEEATARLTTEQENILNNGVERTRWIDKLKSCGRLAGLERKLVTFLIERIDVVDSMEIRITWRFGKEISEMEQYLNDYGKEVI